MVVAGDIRKGTTFVLDSQVYTVTEFMHVKPGKGAAFVRTKLKNVMTGGVVEKTFNPSEKLESAVIETREMQYSYTDGEFYYFMDNETFEQIPISKSVLSDSFKFVRENMECKVLSCKGSVFGVEPPIFVNLKIISTEPGMRGNTATNATKPATLETGAEIRIPLFVNQGDVIRIDTRTGEYVDRA